MSKKDLIKTLTSEIEAKFPDAKIVKVAPNPEIPGGTLLYVTRPENEDRLIALGEYASDRTVDILLDYGFHITVMPVVRNGEPVVA